MGFAVAPLVLFFLSLGSVAALNGARVGLLNASAGAVEDKAYGEPVKYLTDRDTFLCCCAKCGTTSMYHYIYKAEFGAEWPYGASRPYIHDVLSERWRGKFSVPRQEDADSLLASSAFSLALVRDPKERLTSAWRSKVSCAPWGDPAEAKKKKVKGLLALQGKGQTADCLGFDELVSVLHDIHAAGKAAQLDEHFIPQDLYCFRDARPETWKQVSFIGEPGVFTRLGAQLGLTNNATSDDSSAPQTHGSKGGGSLWMSASTRTMFDKITFDEYQALSGFLPSSKLPVTPGVVARSMPTAHAAPTSDSNVSLLQHSMDGDHGTFFGRLGQHRLGSLEKLQQHAMRAQESWSGSK